MSHTTTFTGLVISNVKAIEKAIDLLNLDLNDRSMSELSVATNSVPKLYYDNQFIGKYGKDSTCDIVLKHPKSKYDLGFYWNKDTNQYDLVYDSFGGGIREVFGYSNSEIKEISEQYKLEANETTKQLGRFIQAHNVGLTLCMVEEQGYEVEEVKYQNHQYELVLANSI